MTPGRPPQAIILFALCSCSAVAFAQSNPQAEAASVNKVWRWPRRRPTPRRSRSSAVPMSEPAFRRAFQPGRNLVALGQPVYAVQTLGRYLIEGAKEIPARRRKQVQAEIVRQERLIAAVTFRSEIGDAVGRVDGSEVGQSPMSTAVQVSAGMHVLSAFAPGYRPWEQRLDLHGKDQSLVEIRFEPLAAPVTTPLPAAQVASAPMPQTAAAPATAPVVQSSATARPR